MATTERTIKPLPKDEKDIQSDSLAFYCKRCEKSVKAIQTKRKFTFRCPICSKAEVAFGTELSVKNFYRIKED